MNTKLIYLLIASTLVGGSSTVFAQKAHSTSPYVSQVWNPDLGNGMYKNPVINADYSDPDVVCVGDDYYMTALYNFYATSVVAEASLRKA